MRVALVALALLAAAPAQAGVRVVPPFDPAEYADRAAVGLLVPGAGPTVTREAALAALLRGEARARSARAGSPTGENRIELGAPGEPVILVSLPPPGRSDNDVRYPIALLGARGLLTSDSTRIDGLVSVTDVATGRLRVVPNDDPAQALETLDERIERNSDWRLPLTIALAALLIGARPRPAAARGAGAPRRAGGEPLAEPRCSRSQPASPSCSCRSAGPARRSLPPTSSRWGSMPRRSRSRRSARRSRAGSTGSTTCSRRCCSRPRSSARRCSAAPECSSPRSRSSRSAATASAPTAAGSSSSPPPTSSSGCACAGSRPTWRLAGLVAAGAVAVALALLGLDAASGGSSHVTDAVGDGPVALAGDIADRIELLRAPHRREPRRDRGRARLARDPRRRSRSAPAGTPCSTPSSSGSPSRSSSTTRPRDVLGVGAAIAIALARHTPEHGSLSSDPMRRAAVLFALLACSVGLAGCGGGEETTPTPETIVGTLPGGDDRGRAAPPRSRATPRTARRSSPPPAAAAATRSRRPARPAASAPTSTSRSPTSRSRSTASRTARARCRRSRTA